MPEAATTQTDSPFSPGSYPFRPARPTLTEAAASALAVAQLASLDGGSFHELGPYAGLHPNPAPTRLARPQPIEPRKVQVPFGKYKGLRLGQVWSKDRQYVRWLVSIDLSPGFRAAIDAFLGKSDSRSAR